MAPEAASLSMRAARAAGGSGSPSPAKSTASARLESAARRSRARGGGTTEGEDIDSGLALCHRTDCDAGRELQAWRMPRTAPRNMAAAAASNAETTSESPSATEREYMKVAAELSPHPALVSARTTR